MLAAAGGMLAQPVSSQKAPTRKVAEVEATGREVLRRSGNRTLAAAGLLDVTAAPYRADATGRKDATAALQQAIQDARDARLICHLPAGRYLVSDTLSGIQGVVEWDRWLHEGFVDPWLSTASFEYPCVLRGPGEGGRAVLVLADRAPAFGDPGRPKPVLHFWARSYDEKLRDRPQPNINFNQTIVDVDLDLGRGNPGAVGIHHQGAEGSAIETADDPAAETTLAFVKLLVPVRNPCVYALRWRAGRHSVVRNVYPIRELSHPHGTPMNHPMVRIEGAGGGRWYTNVLLHWWDQGPDYRHLAIDGTREPLAFYMLEPQHGRGTTMVEVRDARNIDIFSVKMEGDFGVLTFKDSRNFRLFGLAGNGMPSRGYALVTLEHCTDFLLANVNPQFKRLGHWGALGTAHHPAGWFRAIEQPAPGVPEIRIPGTGQFVLYQRGRPEAPRTVAGDGARH